MDEPQYTTGFHLVTDLVQLEEPPEAKILLAIHQIARAAEAKVLGTKTHSFTPQGFTAVALLSASHMSFHTWPEHKHMSFDLYTCDAPDSPFTFHAVCDILEKIFEPNKMLITLIERGERHEVQKYIRERH